MSSGAGENLVLWGIAWLLYLSHVVVIEHCPEDTFNDAAVTNIEGTQFLFCGIIIN